MAEPALAKGMAVDEKVKKRLVGAVVLVSLAVIFIPMLLEERTPSSMPTFGSNVPPEPEEQFETLDIPLQLPEALPETRQTVVETEAQATELEQTARKERPARPAPSVAAAEPVKKGTAVAADSPSGVKPKSTSESEGPTGWVVQVGSFKKPANAFRLRNRIRGKGYPAFVEQVRTGDEIIYRVRVGPELSRERVERLKADLAAGMKLNGLVMSHP